MNDKQFTDELFRRMYVLGYRKAEIEDDTPILVKQYEQDEWEKRHFAYFKDERVYAWLCGATSWSADYEGDTTDWNLAKLAEV